MTARSLLGTTSLFAIASAVAIFLFAHDAMAQKVDDGAEYLEDSSAAPPDDGFRPVWQQQARKAAAKRSVQREKARPEPKKQQVAEQQPAAAPTRMETTVYDRWTVTCREVVGKEANRSCSAALRVTDSQQKLVILLELARAKDGKIQALMQTPTGVLVQKGVDLKIGDVAVGKLDYATCVPQNCQAAGAMDDPLLKKITAASEMIVTVHATDGRDVHFKFPLAGADKAVAAVRS
jgi:invasion protein IalB